MNKTEAVLIGLFLGIMCPATLFILAWWITATFSLLHLVPIKESVIVAAAIIGLGFGILLAIFFLKKWIGLFYTVDPKIAMLIYLLWSIFALAFFMGFPFGNIVLGIFAGLYIGRRQSYLQADDEVLRKATVRVSSLAAIVTAAESLPFGLLGLQEKIVGETIQAITGISLPAIRGPIGIGLVLFLFVILFCLQYLITKTTTRLAFRLFK